MKKIAGILGVGFLMLASVASAQQTQAIVARDLIGLGMPAPLASQLSRYTAEMSYATLKGNPAVIANTFAANGGRSDYCGGNTLNAVDGACLKVAGAANNTLGNNGDIRIETANASGANVVLDAGHATAGGILLRTAGVTQWSVVRPGEDLVSSATGGDLIFSRTGAGIREKTGTIAAAGASQGAATLITARVQVVTGATGAAGTGVRFPDTLIDGQKWVVYNNDADILLLYPGGGNNINNTAADTAVQIAGFASARCDVVSASQLWCGEDANP